EATRAILLADDVAGHFWLGVGLLEAARTQNTYAALLVLEGARLHLQLALERDPAFHHAGSWRVLGRMAHRTPPLFGGRKQRALDFYRRALEIAPDNSTTQLYLAELLFSIKRTKEAQKLLGRILSQPRDEDWLWEQGRDQEKARALLQQHKSALA
ncbi:MAG TPA: TRAP transporter TatT component family protein, partial [Abditibacteriaceae bacterium]|nr:TRAP transporter TatT component family protein [Abditibacteriaceae bacterium]